MGTPKAIANDRKFALSAGAKTIRPCAQKTPLPRSRVLYVAGITQRVIKDVLYTKIYSTHGVKTHHPIHPTAIQTSPTPVNINDVHPFPSLPRTLPPVPVPEPPPTSYSRIVTHHQQPTDMTEQLSIFLHEFKTMFSQLIQQNSMILNMLSAVIHKLAN